MKPWSLFRLSYFLLLPAATCFGKDSRGESKSTALSTETTPGSGGFLLLGLLPLLFLALLFFAGTVKIVHLSQQRIATQSRLDLCSLRLLLERQSIGRELVNTNHGIRLSATAIAMARGLSIFGGPPGRLLGAMGEAALVRANHALARWQDARVIYYQARELRLSHCASTPYSLEPAFCAATPSLNSSLHRPPTAFPDVRGPLVFRQTPLARIACRSARGETRRVLEGDVALKQSSFRDFYE